MMVNTKQARATTNLIDGIRGVNHENDETATSRLTGTNIGFSESRKKLSS